MKKRTILLATLLTLLATHGTSYIACAQEGLAQSQNVSESDSLESDSNSSDGESIVRDSESEAEEVLTANVPKPAPASPERKLPKAPSAPGTPQRGSHGPSFATPSPSRRTRAITVPVTPTVRSIHYNFDTPWPTNLAKGGSITATKAAARQSIRDGAKFRQWHNKREEPDFTDVSLWMDDRITEKLNNTLIKAIAQERHLNPSATSFSTPAKQTLDHAFSYNALLMTIIRGNASTYLSVDPNGKLKLVVIAPVNVTYNHIATTHTLTSIGLICLAFSYERGTADYKQLPALLASPRTPAGHQEMLNIAHDNDFTPYYLFHACLHPNDAAAKTQEAYRVPVDVEFDYGQFCNEDGEVTWEGFYFKLV